VKKELPSPSALQDYSSELLLVGPEGDYYADTANDRCPRCGHAMYSHYDDTDYENDGCADHEGNPKGPKCHCVLGLVTVSRDD
jgi:hypothetical protein